MLPSIKSPRAFEASESSANFAASPSTAAFLATPSVRMAMINQKVAAGQQQQQQQETDPFHPATAPVTYGSVLGGALHFWLESIVARLKCERVALFLPHPKHNVLMRVTIVGPTAPPVAAQNAAAIITGRGDSPGAAGPVTVAVLTTGIAANLSQVASEDAQDCPGTTVAKNALVVPIRSMTPGSGSQAIGVIYAVNKKGGSAVFSNEDQLVVVSVAPSIAYLSETYPLDFSAHRFDPSPLRRVVPMQTYGGRDDVGLLSSTSSAGAAAAAGAGGANNKNRKKKSMGKNDYSSSSSSATAVRREQTKNTKKTRRGGGDDDENAEARAALQVLPEKPPQLVYEQHKEDALLPYVNLALEAQRDDDLTGKRGRRRNGDDGVSSSDDDKGGGGGGGGGGNAPLKAAADAATAGKASEFIRSGRAESLQQQAEALSTAEQIISVGNFTARMESCWREAVSKAIALERENLLKNSICTDAHALLHRKQRRLEVLKDVLVETLERRQQPSSAVVPRNQY